MYFRYRTVAGAFWTTVLRTWPRPPPARAGLARACLPCPLCAGQGLHEEKDGAGRGVLADDEEGREGEEVRVKLEKVRQTQNFENKHAN